MASVPIPAPQRDQYGAVQPESTAAFARFCLGVAEVISILSVIVILGSMAYVLGRWDRFEYPFLAVFGLLSSAVYSLAMFFVFDHVRRHYGK